MGKSIWMFFFFFFFLNFVKWTKRIFIEKSCIFFFKGHSNTVCEMRVAWVWLFQKASACYCLPSQLLQAPAPWLPYMRDQGLPRCFWERRAQCERGQTSPQNTNFLCMLGALVGIQTGSLTQPLGLRFFFFSIVVLNENFSVAFDLLRIYSLYSM